MIDLLPTKVDAISSIDHLWLPEKVTVRWARCIPVQINDPVSSALLGCTMIWSNAARSDGTACFKFAFSFTMYSLKYFTGCCACDGWGIICNNQQYWYGACMGGPKTLKKYIFKSFLMSQSWTRDTVPTSTNAIRQPLLHIVFCQLDPPNKLYILTFLKPFSLVWYVIPPLKTGFLASTRDLLLRFWWWKH